MSGFTIQFETGTRRSVPVFDLSTWRLALADSTRAIYRPTFRTFLGRLAWTALAAALFVPLYLVVQPLQSTPLYREWGQYVYMALAFLLGLLAVMPPAGVLWNRVALSRTARNDFEVESWYLWPRRRTWPPGTLGPATVFCKERITFGRHGGVRRQGWYWHVIIGGGLGEEPGAVPGPAEFIVDRQRQRPLDGTGPSRRTAEFLQALRRLGSIEAGVPAVMDATVERGLFSGRVVQRGISMSGPTVVSQTYDSLEDVPPHLQAEVERLMARARPERTQSGTVYRAQSATFVIRDSEGREQVFNSPDEMPPDIRAIYEQMRRPSGGRPYGQ